MQVILCSLGPAQPLHLELGVSLLRAFGVSSDSRRRGR